MKIQHKLFTLSFLILTACATKPTDPDALSAYQQANDPLEPMNRVSFAFNDNLNQFVFRPFDKVYRWIFPEPVRTGVHNFSTNLSQPCYLVNALLQGDFKDGAQIFGRFFTNSTLGIGGLFDVATDLGIEAPKKDFGQTLYTWGVKESGPYLVLPVLGPSNVRDATGTVADFFIDPVDWSLPKAEKHLLLYRYAIMGVDKIDSTSDLLWNLKQSSVDPYAALRTMYQQNRKKVLEEDTENTSDTTPAPADYDFDFEE